MCNRQQNTLRFYIRFSTVSESSEACILFQITKASLGLDTPVHPQHNPLFTGNPLQVFLTVLVEFPGNIQIFRPVFERNFGFTSSRDYMGSGASHYYCLMLSLSSGMITADEVTSQSGQAGGR